MSARFQTATAAREFALGGNAVLTLQSEKTGARFTYKIRAAQDGAVSFVSVLTGQDNEGDYTYLGIIKGFSVHGVRAGEYGRQFPEKGRENHAAIWKLAEEGEVKPRVHAEYPLSEWRCAYETLARRTVVGKTIIRPDL